MKKKDYNEVKKIINSTGEELISKTYKGYNYKLDIKCQKCGNIYSMNLTNFLKNKRCNKCANEKRRNSLKLSYDEVKKIINSTGEELISKTYENSTKKLDIKCQKCGNIYSIRYCNFKSGNRCPKCAARNRNKNNRLNYKEVNNYINSTGDILISKDYHNCHEKLEIKCRICNKIYKTTFNDFKQGGNRCPYCKKSKGELKIAKWLDDNGYEYTEQYRINDCKYKRTLPFDFKLETDDGKIILLEYDGIQHFRKSWYDNKDNLLERQLKDKIKDNYCKDNNIDLYRISYKDFDNIENILENIINLYN